jgi:hypothetical protein
MLLAQGTRIDVQDIIAALGPNSDPGIAWNILLYLIFFLALATMFMQSDKQLPPTLMMAAVAFAAVLDKLQVIATAPVLGQRGFGTLLLHILISTFPFIVAGITKAHKSRGPAIITGILGTILFLGYWALVQRGRGY